VRFLFDENMPKVLASVLGNLGKSVSHTRDVDELGLRTLDERVIAHAADHNQFVVSRDFAMAEEPWFRAEVKRLGAGVFFIRASRKSGKEMRLWPLAQLLVKGWDQIEYYAEHNKPPFVALMKSSGHVSTY